MAKERPVDPDCKDPVDPTACLVQSPVPFRRLEDPCGNVILPDPCTIDPTKFSAAEAVVAAAPVPLVPLLSVQLGNTEVTRSCTDLTDAGTGVTGVPVTIAVNALTAGVPLFEIDGLTEAQRSALAGLSQPTVNGFAGQTALQIAELATLTLAQAEAFKARITADQATLQAESVLLALAGLECYYLNAAQTVTCAPDENAVAADAGTTTVTVAAGAVRSTLSLAAANLDAQSLGLSQLECRWLNTVQTVTCATPGAVNYSHTVAAATLTSPTSRADANTQAAALASGYLDCRYANDAQTATCVGGALVQSGANPITVAAGTIFSAINAADATAQALAVAQASLTCRWENTERVKTCPQDTGHEASPTASPVRQATVPAGTFSSTLSQADANEQADLFATAQLDCRYCNTLVEALCVTGGSYDQTAAVVAGTFCESTYAAAQQLATALAAIPVQVQVTGTPTCHFTNDRVVAGCAAGTGITVVKFAGAAAAGLSASSSGSITVDAGAITSTVSKADANTQAQALALASLNCFFDSAEKEFKCAGTGHSTNATQPFTVAAAMFRSYTSLTEANAQRDSYGSSQLDCFWDSDASAPIKCAADASTKAYPQFAAPVTLQVGFFTSYTSKAEANALRDVYAASILNCFWDSAASAPIKCAADASAQAYPQFAAPVTLPVGFFTSYNSQSEANSLRDSYAASILNCFWDSDASAPIKCPADAASGSYPAFGTPVTIPAAFFTSYTSKAEANTLRDLYAASILVCFWRNAAQQSWCDGTAATEAQAPNSVTIAADTIVSFVSKTDANNLALALATASLTCIYSNAAQTGDACAGGTTQMQTGAVAAGTIMASSKAAANALAKTLANALNVCVADSIFLSSGSAGAQGPSGNCSTNCGAYYS